MNDIDYVALQAQQEIHELVAQQAPLEIVQNAIAK